MFPCYGIILAMVNCRRVGNTFHYICHSEKNNMVLFVGPIFTCKFNNSLRSKTNMSVHFSLNIKATRNVQAGSSQYFQAA